MKFQYDDGGRAAAGWKGSCGDCVVRSIAIAARRPYDEVYAALSEGMRTQRLTKNRRRKSSARSGVSVDRKWFRYYMEALGFRWVPTMQIGSGCTVHLRDGELPSGRLVASVSRHLVAVIDGVIHDTYDPSRSGSRCVYGYWKLDEKGGKKS